jgi:hypothetical protein
MGGLQSAMMHLDCHDLALIARHIKVLTDSAGASHPTLALVGC